MIPLSSKLENVEDAFVNVYAYLGDEQFSLGGNWDYDHGFFDRNLDEEQKVWLRLPFQVTHGTMEGESDQSDAVIKFGQPFVLKHVYNEGLDNRAEAKVLGALVDQFQKPVDSDAEVEPGWVRQAEDVLREVEKGMLQ
ncbi:YugN family protein [Paenibacillus sp. MBLB4367]|uniref:YugN family protein n=1 Tax=Paenibacillus sp. MBLB4367 TaxID=3384767 RepID=UPI003907EAF8